MDKVILKSIVSQEIIDNVYMNIAKLLSGHTTNIDTENFHGMVVKSLVYCENENNANCKHCNQFSQNTKPPNSKLITVHCLDNLLKFSLISCCKIPKTKYKNNHKISILFLYLLLKIEQIDALK